MEFYTLSDKGIEQELGHRIKALRLRKNITQQELANSATLSVNAIKSLESGRGKLSTLIAVLRELSALDQLDNFIPETVISPLQLAKMQGKLRERASGYRRKKKSQGEEEW
jgi:transcriptional regulator with XRE-family HTH domain